MSQQTILTAGSQALRYDVQWQNLPLAIYREIAAHLQQVPGVQTKLLPQRSEQFDYHQSQVGSLQIQYDSEIEPAGRQRVDQILAYYSDRYGAILYQEF